MKFGSETNEKPFDCYPIGLWTLEKTQKPPKCAEMQIAARKVFWKPLNSSKIGIWTVETTQKPPKWAEMQGQNSKRGAKMTGKVREDPQKLPTVGCVSRPKRNLREKRRNRAEIQKFPKEWLEGHRESFAQLRIGPWTMGKPLEACSEQCLGRGSHRIARIWPCAFKFWFCAVDCQ